MERLVGSHRQTEAEFDGKKDSQFDLSEIKPNKKTYTISWVFTDTLIFHMRCRNSCCCHTITSQAKYLVADRSRIFYLDVAFIWTQR